MKHCFTHTLEVLVDMSFEEKLEEILNLSADLEAEGDKIKSVERGFKKAHLQARRLIAQMRKALPELKKLSLMEENQ